MSKKSYLNSIFIFVIMIFAVAVSSLGDDIFYDVTIRHNLTVGNVSATGEICSMYGCMADCNICNTSTFVPYTGATKNVDLGSHNLTTTGFGQFAWVDKLEQITGAIVQPPANTLRLYVEDKNGFSQYKYLDDTGMVRQIVRDSVFIVKNTGANIPKMSAVYDCGSSENVPLVCLAQANNRTKAQAIGVTIEAINTNAFGRVMMVGLLENVNTNAYAEGNLLYLSAGTAGGFTTIPPVTPNLTQVMGTVLIKDATNGAIQILARELTGDEFGTINNFRIAGNLSVRRPYWNGYDNSTQKFLNTANVQVINISNNNDYDAYGIKVVNRQNLTFDQTGDYLCILSPEFYQASGTRKVITFWFQKNGVDVPWSNSRYTMSNEDYTAPAIPYQFNIKNPLTDNIRFMWYSDSTSTQIYSSGALTSPTRPSIPGIILNCQKVSEVVPSEAV